VDALNIAQASVRAMNIAIDKLQQPPSHVFVDGNYFHSCTLPFTTLIKGDARCLSIAAASILAKVTRDRFMKDIAEKQFPEYGFAQHKGYATQQHRKAIKKHGSCVLHRQTFITKIMQERAQEASGTQQELFL
jgi:ribonuclease HII